MTSPSNPSAFPHVNPSFDDNWNKERQVEGMSLRDYIAVAVLQAISMTPKEFESIFIPIYGAHGWQKKLADISGFTPNTINNYKAGRRKISKPNAMYFTLLSKVINEVIVETIHLSLK